MVGKKGYIRTLEAVIAIVIILLFIFTVTPERVINPKKAPPQIESAQNYIFQKIENNPGLRAMVIGSSGDGECKDVAPEINDLVFDNLPPGFDFVCAICSTTSCVFTPEGITTSVYMDDIMITPYDVHGSPKIIRVWFWAL